MQNSFDTNATVFNTLAEEKLPSYVNYLPTGYFNISHSPLFRIRIDESINSFYDALKGTTDPIYQNRTAFMPANITFYDNLFDASSAM